MSKLVYILGIFGLLLATPRTASCQYLTNKLIVDRPLTLPTISSAELMHYNIYANESYLNLLKPHNKIQYQLLILALNEVMLDNRIKGDSLSIVLIYSQYCDLVLQSRWDKVNIEKLQVAVTSLYADINQLSSNILTFADIIEPRHRKYLPPLNQDSDNGRGEPSDDSVYFTDTTQSINADGDSVKYGTQTLPENNAFPSLNNNSSSGISNDSDMAITDPKETEIKRLNSKSESHMRLIEVIYCPNHWYKYSAGADNSQQTLGFGIALRKSIDYEFFNRHVNTEIRAEMIVLQVVNSNNKEKRINTAFQIACIDTLPKLPFLPIILPPCYLGIGIVPGSGSRAILFSRQTPYIAIGSIFRILTTPIQLSTQISINGYLSSTQLGFIKNTETPSYTFSGGGISLIVGINY